MSNLYFGGKTIVKNHYAACHYEMKADARRALNEKSIFKIWQ